MDELEIYVSDLYDELRETPPINREVENGEAEDVEVMLYELNLKREFEEALINYFVYITKLIDVLNQLLSKDLLRAPPQTDENIEMKSGMVVDDDKPTGTTFYKKPENIDIVLPKEVFGKGSALWQYLLPNSKNDGNTQYFAVWLMSYYLLAATRFIKPPYIDEVINDVYDVRGHMSNSTEIRIPIGEIRLDYASRGLRDKPLPQVRATNGTQVPVKVPVTVGDILDECVTAVQRLLSAIPVPHPSILSEHNFSGFVRTHNIVSKISDLPFYGDAEESSVRGRNREPDYRDAVEHDDDDIKGLIDSVQPEQPEQPPTDNGREISAAMIERGEEYYRTMENEAFKKDKKIKAMFGKNIKEQLRLIKEEKETKKIKEAAVEAAVKEEEAVKEEKVAKMLNDLQKRNGQIFDNNDHDASTLAKASSSSLIERKLTEKERKNLAELILEQARTPAELILEQSRTPAVKRERDQREGLRFDEWLEVVKKFTAKSGDESKHIFFIYDDYVKKFKGDGAPLSFDEWLKWVAMANEFTAKTKDIRLLHAEYLAKFNKDNEMSGGKSTKHRKKSTKRHKKSTKRHKKTRKNRRKRTHRKRR